VLKLAIFSLHERPGWALRLLHGVVHGLAHTAVSYIYLQWLAVTLLCLHLTLALRLSFCRLLH
jgi:hypothetical protein